MTAALPSPTPNPAAAPQSPMIQAVELASGYGGRAVVRDVSFAAPAGEMLGIIGPNGCGKSTLLQTLAGSLKSLKGRVLLQGAPMDELPRRQRARVLAMLPQHPEAPPGMSVRDLVRCGRSPHVRPLQPFASADQHVIEQAIVRCELQALADRPVAELSGGERQRAWIAMTLAQQPRVLLLDEPTSALDVGHQLEVLHLLAELARDERLAVIVVMHDINAALRYCNRVLVMHRGRLVGRCDPADRSSFALLEEVFDVQARPAGPGGAPLQFSRPQRDRH